MGFCSASTTPTRTSIAGRAVKSTCTTRPAGKASRTCSTMTPGPSRRNKRATASTCASRLSRNKPLGSTLAWPRAIRADSDSAKAVTTRRSRRIPAIDGITKPKASKVCASSSTIGLAGGSLEEIHGLDLDDPERAAIANTPSGEATAGAEIPSDPVTRSNRKACQAATHSGSVLRSASGRTPRSSTVAPGAGTRAESTTWMRSAGAGVSTTPIVSAEVDLLPPIRIGSGRNPFVTTQSTEGPPSGTGRRSTKRKSPEASL